MQIIHLPIEPFPHRYTQDWYNWYSCRMTENEKIIIGDCFYGTIVDGSFLDVTGTILCKNDQMRKIIKFIRNNKDTFPWKETVFFFHDLWHPGVTDLLYIRDGLKLPFKIAGMLHAGTYDSFDFLAQQGMTPWGSYIECAWFNNVDLIFVATEFHKKLLTSTRVNKLLEDRVVVTGFPIYPRYEFSMDNRPRGVIFPHRLNKEKQPELFTKFAHEICNRDATVYCDKTIGVCKNKVEYFQKLRSYKVGISFALQETWGIAMQEVVFAGAFPLVPDRLSYSELYLDRFKYPKNASMQEIVDRALDLLNNYDTESYRKDLEEQYHFFEHSGSIAIENQKRLLGQLF